MAISLTLSLMVAIGGTALALVGHVGGGSAADVWLFIGRFHPLLLHLPIGGVAFLLFMEVLGLLSQGRTRPPRVEVLCFVVLGAVVTVLLGLALGQDVGYGTQLLNRHFIWGALFAAAAGLTLAVALAGQITPARWTGPAYVLSMAVLLVTLGLAGHFGASLTHGETYLTHYAPPGLRPWMERALGIPSAAETTTEIPEEQRTVYAARIAPLLGSTCLQCHGPQRQRGGLRLDSVAAMLQGGERGPALVPGSPDESRMVRFMELPPHHEDHMPPTGKAQPTADQIALIRAWVAVGAPEATTVAEASWLPVAPSNGQQDPVDAMISPERLDALVREVERINRAVGGAPLTFIARGRPELRFSGQSLGQNLSADHLEQLAGIADHLVELDLSFTSLDAPRLQRLPTLPRLVWINLAATPTDDAMLPIILSRTPALETMVAYQTRISDSSVSALAEHPTLRRVVLSMSRTTPEAPEAARVLDGELEIVVGS